MTKGSSKVTIHMVSSLDGFVAKKDNDVTWLQTTDHYDKGITLSDEDIVAYLKKIDCYIMGSQTYEHALTLGWPYGDTPVIVLTNRALTSDKANVKFYSGDIVKLLKDQVKPSYQGIWIVGGPTVIKEFLRFEIVDEIIISIMPVILGDGLLFFDYVGKEQALHLEDSVAYDNGMVELTYSIRKN